MQHHPQVDASPRNVEILVALVSSLDLHVREIARWRSEFEAARGDPARTASARSRLAEHESAQRVLAKSLIPDHLRFEMGAMQFVLPDGRTVRLDPAPEVAISDTKLPELISWLEANEHSSVAAQLTQAISEHGRKASQVRKILQGFLMNLQDDGPHGKYEQANNLIGVRSRHVARLQ